MSYNGSGTFVVNSSGQPVVTGTVISSTAFNALTADLATGLSTAITKDGQTTTTARIVFAQGVSSTLVTDATSATTGSIITAGGISCQKALWVGTTATIAGATTMAGITATSLALGGATLGTNALAVTGTTLLNSALTYGGVTLSNSVTGTGSMVLSASPTFTTVTAVQTGSGATGSRVVQSAPGSSGGAWTEWAQDAALTSVWGAGTAVPGGSKADALIFSRYTGAWAEVARFDSSGKFVVGGTNTGYGVISGYGSDGTIFGFDAKTTLNVSTSATTIGTNNDVGFYMVIGASTTPTHRFTDIVLGGYQTATVIGTQNTFGNPAARTYSVTGASFQLAMASGTYDISVFKISMPQIY